MYVPNADHGLDQRDRPVEGLLALHAHVTGRASLPRLARAKRHRGQREPRHRRAVRPASERDAHGDHHRRYRPGGRGPILRMRPFQLEPVADRERGQRCSERRDPPPAQLGPGDEQSRGEDAERSQPKRLQARLHVQEPLPLEVAWLSWRCSPAARILYPFSRYRQTEGRP